LACLCVDFRGRICLDPTVGEWPPDRLALAICADLGELVGLELTPIVARFVPGTARAFGALVTLRVGPGEQPVVTTATAMGPTQSQALAMAALAALGATDDLLTLYASRLDTVERLPGVTVSDRMGMRFHAGRLPAETHLDLIGLVPSPGRLCVVTEDLEHRVLCLPEAAIVVSLACGDPVSADVAEALARIGRACYPLAADR
jgi:hypothetical protein